MFVKFSVSENFGGPECKVPMPIVKLVEATQNPVYDDKGSGKFHYDKTVGYEQHFFYYYNCGDASEVVVKKAIEKLKDTYPRPLGKWGKDFFISEFTEILECCMKEPAAEKKQDAEEFQKDSATPVGQWPSFTALFRL